MSTSRPFWLRALPVVGLGIALFVVMGFLYELGGPPGQRFMLAALLASLGGLFGSSLALDGRSGLAVADAPAWRVFASGVFGVCAALVIEHWLPTARVIPFVATGAAVGCLLGWFGWRWARLVNF